MHKYVIISPVKDEERYIESTIESVVSQTLKPDRWIIVDDGSLDQTTQMLEKYTGDYKWIRMLRTQRGAERQPGSAVIRAFNRGYEEIRHETFDFVVKLDCDLRFSPTYFEELLVKFDQDRRLGIGSGVYLENAGMGWLPVRMPEYHAAGASKVIRRACFEGIKGFIPSRGWDTVDEIRAQMLGWKTTHFREITFFHLKPEGSGIGDLKTNAMHGEVYYLTGGSSLFLAVKILHRMVSGRPPILSGIALLIGFLKPLFMRRERLVDVAEAAFYRQILNMRMTSKLKHFVKTGDSQKGG